MSTEDPRDTTPEEPRGDRHGDGGLDARPSGDQQLPDMPTWHGSETEAHPTAAPEADAAPESIGSESSSSSVEPPATAAPHTPSVEPSGVATSAPRDDAASPSAPRDDAAAPSAPRDDAAAHADAGEPTTRPPLGGPYVVDGSGAPIAEQAKEAYTPRPQGGPYVTSSEPVPAGDESAPSAARPADPIRPAEIGRPADIGRRPEFPSQTRSDDAGAAPIGAGAALAAASAAGAAPTAPHEAPARTPYPAAAFAPTQRVTTPADEDPYPEATALPVEPVPPRARGNRGIGALISLVGTVAFAAVYAGVSFLIISATVPAEQYLEAFLAFLVSAAFLAPVVMFAIAMILLVLIVNRAGWWAYVLGGFLVAVVVYFGAIAGAVAYAYLTGVATGWGAQDQYDFVAALTLNPLTIAAAVVAREASIWTGAWISARGRKLKSRNAADREEYLRAREEYERERDAAAVRRSASSEQAPTATAW